MNWYINWQDLLSCNFTNWYNQWCLQHNYQPCDDAIVQKATMEGRKTVINHGDDTNSYDKYIFLKNHKVQRDLNFWKRICA